MGVTEYPPSVKVVGRLAIDCDGSYAEGISEGPAALQSPQSNGRTGAPQPQCLIRPINSQFSYSRRSLELFNMFEVFPQKKLSG